MRRRRCLQASSRTSPPPWHAFIEGVVYADAEVPWGNDPAYGMLQAFPGLRETVNGRIAAAITQTLGLVQALTQVDVLQSVHANRPARGVCLGFGMNALEPYDLLQACALDIVHAYEWIGAEVVDAAQMLDALRAFDPLLPTRIRLHHSTLRRLETLTDASVHVVYAASVFNDEIPMSAATFQGALREIVRVLAPGGFVVSRGSSGLLEAHLTPYGHMLLETPQVAVFQRDRCARIP
jgi:methyltransferase family protein